MIDRRTFASWVSPAARSAFLAIEPGPPLGADLHALREHYDAFNRKLLAQALAAHRVQITPSVIDGIPVHSVTPHGGPVDACRLICLHGGAFMWGAGAGALLEAVPLAAAMKCEVVAVDYRLAPEHLFPAAVDDVVAVFRHVASQVAAHRVGIYGCSAGGMLTAQAVARLVTEADEPPGAIAMLHGTGLEFEGDMVMTSPMFAPDASSGASPTTADMPYFRNADLSDPLVLPGNHPGVLGQFPPSLLVTSTRDFAASACMTMHRRLLAAGVDARLVVFDGLWHAHHMDVTLAESQETIALMARFFTTHLG